MMEWSERVTLAIFVLLFLLSLALLSTKAPAQEHLHVGKAGELYEKWMRPEDVCKTTPNTQAICGRRKISCCNRIDCRAVQVKQEGGHWFFLDILPPTGQSRWREIPDEIVEANQPDPVESPDGMNHVCASPAHVYCFTVGSMQ
jgi:hypothetical protein